jgi:hypothetical protein
MMVKCGLEFFHLKFSELLLTCQATSAFLERLFLYWAAATLKGLAEFQDKFF